MLLRVAESRSFFNGLPMSKFRSALDYVPPVIAFIAAGAAVVGSPKWDPEAEGLLKITPYGWFVLTVGALALIASLLVTARNKGDQAKQKKLKEQIAALGRAQLLRAINHIVHPISYSAIWKGHCDSPETPVDLLTPERRKVFAALNVNSASPYSDGSFDEIKWHSMLGRASKEGAKQITTALQIYSGYLSPEVMDAVTKVLYSDFLRYRLQLIHELVLANAHKDTNRPVPFFSAAEDNPGSREYEEFWPLLEAAMVLCGAEKTRAGRPRFLHR